jgi:hypothetical protein
MPPAAPQPPTPPIHPDDLAALAGSTARLRWALGWLGLALPTSILLWGLVAPEQPFPLSLSATYYLPNRGALFVGTLCAIGVFLIFYQGHRPRPPAWQMPFLNTRPGRVLDRWLTDRSVTTLAGLGALATALVPTVATGARDCGAFACSVGLHALATAVFLIALIWMAVFQFTKSDKPKAAWSREKRAANAIYLGCGAAMTGALVAMGVQFLLADRHGAGLPWPKPPVFWLEAVAVWAFGLAWLVKSGTGLGAVARRVAGRLAPDRA